MATPPLGWIDPKDRTPSQHAAHAMALATMAPISRYKLPSRLADGQKIILSQVWKNPKVVADVGMEFEGFRQYTGSCIGVSEGGAVFTVGAMQRLLATKPTKALIPFWPVQYGRCRLHEGDHGQGEGAINSSMVYVLIHEGVVDITQPGLPTFDKSDGLALTASLEMQYSDGASSICTKWLGFEGKHLLGAGAVANNPDDLAAGIINGYPGYFGCSNYCDRASVQGSGDDAVLLGTFNGRGGHSQAVYGVWQHSKLGRLFLVGNTWDRSTYPTDPAGGPRCSFWCLEAEFAKVWNRFGGEVFNLSHLDWFPAQPDVPDVLNWYPWSN